MKSERVYKVPPDGGYGWVVAFAYALNNVVVLPLIAGFGLIFQEAFDETGLSATQGTLIIILNHSLGMLISFFGGPVLRRFGYRKVAAVGALLISSGLILTAVSNNFWLFFMSYSIINSMGVAAVMAAFTLAINSFFKEKRGRAIGIAMSITGLGTIYMPLVMSSLMYAFGWRYAVLILSALCLHSLLAACLLQPAKWYLKDPPTIEETVPLNNGADVELVNGSVTTPSKPGLPSLVQLVATQENGDLQSKSLSMRSLTNNSYLQARNAISHPDIRTKSPEIPLAESRYKWWESQEVNLGSSVNIFNEVENIKKSKEIVDEINEKKADSKTYFDNFVDFFDLTLLRDPIFVNILLGLSIAACVETNFTLLLPIILKDMLQFETSDIAKIMSVIGFSDSFFRILAPFIGEWCHKPPRVMYIVSLLMIIFVRCRQTVTMACKTFGSWVYTRSVILNLYSIGATNIVLVMVSRALNKTYLVMLFTTSFTGMLFVSLAMGITKGLRTVYMNVVIPSYVPIERLPFASGIQMFFNGIAIISVGTLLGRIRESSGSYVSPIIVLNIVTMVTVVIWSAEFLYFRIKNKNNIKEQTGA